jgi:hypothetical protein
VHQFTDRAIESAADPRFELLQLAPDVHGDHFAMSPAAAAAVTISPAAAAALPPP